jgi:hypothetical protein
LDTLPQVTRAVIIAVILASDLNAIFLGKENVYSAGESNVLDVALGPACAARAALVAKALTPPPWRRAQRHLLDWRVFQGNIQVRRRYGQKSSLCTPCSSLV